MARNAAEYKHATKPTVTLSSKNPTLRACTKWFDAVLAAAVALRMKTAYSNPSPFRGGFMTAVHNINTTWLLVCSPANKIVLRLCTALSSQPHSARAPRKPTRLHLQLLQQAIRQHPFAPRPHLEAAVLQHALSMQYTGNASNKQGVPTGVHHT
jgi:hypothetical protein